jgi:hypothetical protein
MQYFRPARGLYTKAKYSELVETTDYRLIMWNLDPSDWLAGRDPNEILALVRTAVANPTTPTTDDPYNYPEYPRHGSFVMLGHDNHDTMLQEVDSGGSLLGAMIDTIREAGFRIVSLDECLGVDSVEFDLAALGNDTGTACDGIQAPGTTLGTNYCGSTWFDATSCEFGTCPNGLDSDCSDGAFCFAGVECSSVDYSEGTSNYCGPTWSEATSCDYSTCPNGVDSDCPDGTFCFAGVQCLTSAAWVFFPQIAIGLGLGMLFLGSN